MRARVFVVIAALVIASARMGAAQVGTTLGPKDGASLAPTDLARVAVGSPAPDFTLESKDGPTLTLSAYRGQKNVVLIFYRGYW